MSLALAMALLRAGCKNCWAFLSGSWGETLYSRTGRRKPVPSELFVETLEAEWVRTNALC